MMIGFAEWKEEEFPKWLSENFPGVSPHYVQEEVMKAFYELNEALKKYTLTEEQIQHVTNMFMFTFRNYISKTK